MGLIISNLNCSFCQSCKKKYYEVRKVQANQTNAKSSIPSISAQDFITLYLNEKKPQDQQNFVVLDVRYKQELKKWQLPRINDMGQEPKVINIDLPSLRNNYEESIKSIPKDKTVFCLCYVGARSGQATQMLLKDDFRAFNIQGGLCDLNKIDPDLYPIY